MNVAEGFLLSVFTNQLEASTSPPPSRKSMGIFCFPCLGEGRWEICTLPGWGEEFELRVSSFFSRILELYLELSYGK